MTRTIQWKKQESQKSNSEKQQVKEFSPQEGGETERRKGDRTGRVGVRSPPFQPVSE